MYDILVCSLYSSKNKNMPCSVISLKNGIKRRVRQVFFFFFPESSLPFVKDSTIMIYANVPKNV